MCVLCVLMAQSVVAVRLSSNNGIMISVESLRVEFGVKPLFADASFVVNDRDRIALVGKTVQENRRC